MMNHTGTISLETPRLVLRPFIPEDAPAMFRNWASDEAVTEYLTWPTHTDVDVTRRVLSDWIAQYGEPTFYQWAIELKAIHEPIGSLSVVRMDEAIREAELGWCIGRRWWGQGLVPEAAGAVLRYLFREVGFNRIAARHAVDNEKSGRVMQKLGMAREGVMRQAAISNQGLEDVVQYAMLSKENLDKNP